MYFALYLVLWTVAVSAALTNATGLGIANLTGGLVPQSWGAVAHSLIGFVLVWFGGYERLREADEGARRRHGVQHPDLRRPHDDRSGAGSARGCWSRPFPPDGGRYVLSLIGGIGGSITMLSYNYWMREEKMQGPGYLRLRPRRRRRGLHLHRHLRAVGDADRQPGVLPARRDHHAMRRPCRKWPRCWARFSAAFGVYAYSVGFWAAVSAALFGVWQSVPYLYADLYGI